MAKPKSKTKAAAQTTTSAAAAAPTATLAARRSRSLLAQSCRFLGTTAGLDLTLRFFHGLVIISAKAADEAVATRSFMAASQLNLARRYLRFFVLLDCIQNVLDTISKEYASLAYKTFDLVEWSCLLLYFALENLTMLHDMQIHVVPWYAPVLVEANKFWFYAITASILRTIAQRIGLFHSTRTPFSKRRQQLPPPPPPWRRLVVDALDLTLPASFVGWVVMDDVTIGCLMTLSTILAWRDVWGKAQQ
ncbi:PEX11 domain protein [Beauveria bassiana ARSEF 2860]|uniref:PEX11 domain protein n=1 Tax=Beauveria bassiana (strain ARSEF 2860) TaxID=655819 RepID=J5JB13_BEAB2|nr:PEX11 domain protein [Beauveria bassiana ARSEF 2860]EJP63318.1 PEX11 domain protein [Beauveria bassiana ARSEF 2860]